MDLLKGVDGHGNAKNVSEVTQLCPTLWDPMDCSLPCSSIHGIFQTRVLEWVAISLSRESSQPRDQTRVSRVVGRSFTVWATREGKDKGNKLPCFPLTSVSETFFSSVQSLSHVQLFATPWTAAHQVSLSITNSQSLLKRMSIETVMPSNCLILCHPLLLPSIFPNIRVFSNELDFHIRWPNYWSFSFSSSPSNEYSGLISFRIDWFWLIDLLTVQQTLKSLLQHHSLKASVL